MIKKNYLSFQENELYQTLKHSKTTFTTSMVVDLFPSYKRQRINELLSSLKNKDYISQLKKGVYETKHILKSNIDLFATALSIYPGYISHLSALRYYNLIDYEPMTIFVSTKNKSKELTNGSFVYKFINNKFYSHYIFKDGIHVSSLEKTFFDCFYNPLHSGNYSVITKAMFDACDYIDWSKFKKIYSEYGSNRQFQKTGYILDLLKTKTTTNIPQHVIDFFNSKKKSKTKLLNINSKSTYIREWNLQDNLGVNNIISWWY